MIKILKIKDKKSKIWGLANEFATHPLFAGSLVMIAGSNAVNFLNYIYHLIIGRMLGPSFYGELASLISLIGLLGIIPGSLSLVIIKYISASKNEEEMIALISWLKTRLLKASLIFVIAIIVISPMIVSFLHINKLSYIFLIAISFFISIQSLLNRSILQGMLRFKEMILSVFLENGAKLIISVSLVYLGFRVGGAVFSFAMAAFLGWLITNYYLKIRVGKNSQAALNIRPMLTYSIPVLVQSFAITSLYSSDVILIRHFFSSHEAGIYASLSTMGKIIFFGAGPIASVMFPLISQRKSREQSYKKIFGLSFLGTAILASSVLLIYWLFPDLAIQILYGSSFLEAKGLLFWFGLFITLFTLSSLLINYGLSLGRTQVVVLPTIAAILQIILIWFFHKTLFLVILISIMVTALLLAALLIYSIYSKDGDQSDINNRSGI